MQQKRLPAATLESNPASAVVDASASSLPDDKGAAAQADRGCEPWDASDDFDRHAVVPNDNPL